MAPNRCVFFFRKKTTYKPLEEGSKAFFIEVSLNGKGKENG